MLRSTVVTVEKRRFKAADLLVDPPMNAFFLADQHALDPFQGTTTRSAEEKPGYHDKVAFQRRATRLGSCRSWSICKQ